MWLSESVKNGKFVTKIFFSDNVEWSSKNMLKISADVKANKKTRNKRSSDTVSYEFININKKYLQNLKHNVKDIG